MDNDFIDYDEIPISYCSHCGSLMIIEDETGDYCGDCGRSSIGQTSIDVWIEDYSIRYGEKYVNK